MKKKPTMQELGYRAFIESTTPEQRLAWAKKGGRANKLRWIKKNQDGNK